MPIYEYRCEKGHVLEVMQRMSDGPLEACTTCGTPVQRVFHPIAVHFKGSGFYNTDYGKAKNNKAKEGKEGKEGKGESSSDSSSGSDSKSDSSSSDSKSSASKSSDSKSESKTSKASASSSD